jgi:FixJ family two-component response regulator
MRMPGMSGAELQDRLHAEGAGIPIIIVTGHGDIAMAVRSIKNGAFDFIEKPYRAGALIDRIQAALRHDARLRDKQALREDVEARVARLTPREREVLGLLTGGETVKQIAVRLGLSHKTVQVHRAHIMEKTEAGSLADLIRYSMTLVDP